MFHSREHLRGGEYIVAPTSCCLVRWTGRGWACRVALVGGSGRGHGAGVRVRRCFGVVAATGRRARAGTRRGGPRGDAGGRRRGDQRPRSATRPGGTVRPGGFGPDRLASAEVNRRRGDRTIARGAGCRAPTGLGAALRDARCPAAGQRGRSRHTRAGARYRRLDRHLPLREGKRYPDLEEDFRLPPAVVLSGQQRRGPRRHPAGRAGRVEHGGRSHRGSRRRPRADPGRAPTRRPPSWSERTPPDARTRSSPTPGPCAPRASMCASR
jgi:hypothetical protein